jgi:hypothetical protein
MYVSDYLNGVSQSATAALAQHGFSKLSYAFALQAVLGGRCNYPSPKKHD